MGTLPAQHVAAGGSSPHPLNPAVLSCTLGTERRPWEKPCSAWGVADHQLKVRVEVAWGLLAALRSLVCTPQPSQKPWLECHLLCGLHPEESGGHRGIFRPLLCVTALGTLGAPVLDPA